MSINSIGSNIPIQVSLGGIGVGSLTQYGVLYGNNTGPVQATAVGTVGQVLTSNGPGVAPTFQTQSVTPGSGAWVFIQTLTASASTSLVFNTGLSSSFPNVVFVVDNVLSSSLNDRFVLDVSADGGSTWLFSNGNVVYTNTSTGTWSTTNSSTIGYISPLLIQNSGPGYGAVIYYMTVNVPSADYHANGQFFIPITAGGGPYMGVITSSSQTGSVVTINAFRFRMLTGNIATGSITLYGLRNS